MVYCYIMALAFQVVLIGAGRGFQDVGYRVAFGMGSGTGDIASSYYQDLRALAIGSNIHDYDCPFGGLAKLYVCYCADHVNGPGGNLQYPRAASPIGVLST